MQVWGVNKAHAALGQQAFVKDFRRAGLGPLAIQPFVVGDLLADKRSQRKKYPGFLAEARTTKHAGPVHPFGSLPAAARQVLQVTPPAGLSAMDDSLI